MFQRALGNKSVSALFKATVSGMLLPICSCGVIPLGLGLYYSGAYLGPVLAFMVATPIINPAAVILFWMMSPSLWSKDSLFPPGPSGCGKTTLLTIAGRLYAPQCW
jgi:hypothetical protein